ncbi:MAG: EAL domain-containing protein [Pseudomonadota bacterium]
MNKILYRIISLLVALCLLPDFVFANEAMMLGRLSAPENEVGSFLPHAAFFLFMLGFISSAYMILKGVISEKALPFFCAAAALFSVTLPASNLISDVFSFEHFNILTNLSGAALLGGLIFLFFQAQKNNFKNIEFLSLSTIGSLFVSVTLLSFFRPQEGAKILLMIWCFAASAFFAWSLFQIALKEKSDGKISFLICVMTTGILFAAALHDQGTTDIVMVKLLAWFAVFSALGLYIYSFAKPSPENPQIEEALESLNIPNESPNSDAELYFIFDVKEKTIKISDDLACLLNIRGIKREYKLDHFKALVRQPYHSHFLKALHDLDISSYFKFHGNDALYGLTSSSDINTSLRYFTFYLVSQNEAEKDVTALPPSEEIAKEKIASHASPYEAYLYHAKKAILPHVKNAGSFCCIILRVANFDLLQIETSQDEAQKIIDLFIARLSQATMPFAGMVVMQTSQTEITAQFYCNTPDEDIERMKKLILSELETPIECSIGTFFLQAILGTAYEDTRSFLFDHELEHVEKLYEAARKSLLLCDQSQQNFSIKDLISHLPDGASLSALSSALRYAPEKKQIEAYYDLVLDLQTGDVRGFRPHAVWLHPDHGMISHDLLQPLAHYIGYEAILHKIIQAASLERLSHWKLSHQADNIFMYIELSDSILKHHKSFLSDITLLMEKLALQPSSLHILCAADCFAHDNDILFDLIKSCKERQFTVSLNMFGSGHANMSVLSNMPFDRVILSEVYAENLKKDERKYFTLTSLTKMLNNLNVKADISGVSDKHSLPLLRSLGIENIMGPVCGIPLSAGNMTALLKKNKITPL